jgi:hypothetical protein
MFTIGAGVVSAMGAAWFVWYHMPAEEAAAIVRQHTLGGQS